MSRRSVAHRKILDAWEPPAHAGEPVGAVASTFTFDPDFFEEELLARFFHLETSSTDSRAYCAEREERLGNASAVVLVDRRHAARTSTFAWDVLPVPVANQCCQHSKVTVLAWERVIRVIVSSANLTMAGYRRNLEVFAALDFGEGGEVPRSILTATLDFLERTIRRVPSMEDGAGAVGRALGLLSAIRRRSRELQIPEDWAPKALRVVPMFLEPDGEGGVLEHMSDVWGDGPRPALIEVCSPFWAAAANGTNPLVDALASHMAARGERVLKLLVPGEPDADGAWVLQAPHGALDSLEDSHRLTVEIHAVPSAQRREHRVLHGKVQRWSRGSGRDLLLVGSSNATEAGLGIGSSVRNIEANLCFVSDGATPTSATFDANFPDAQPIEGAIKYSARETGEEGEERPVVPEFFAWAEYTRIEGVSRLVIGFDLSRSEPDSWSLSTSEGQAILHRVRFLELQRPERFEAELGGENVPYLVKVRWQDDGQTRESELIVNAGDEGSRCDPTADVTLDLDTLLDTLSSRVPLWRRLVEILRRTADPGANRAGVELDPHRRVDTSAFLMQRMRRISRALEGLRERLSAPVATPSSLEWRFRGPLGPTKVARVLIDSLGGPSDVAFVLAELALTVARASRSVRADGVEADVVEQQFRQAVDEIAEMVRTVRDDPALESYVKRALGRARGGIGQPAAPVVTRPDGTSEARP